MADHEAYMLSRDAEESKRLDWQHEWIKGIAGDRLFHPSIPLDRVGAVADIATGTGAWIRDVEDNWPSLSGVSHGTPKLVGFDISDSQFRKSRMGKVSLVVHDATRPFPGEYEGSFDVVNVRLMSYAIRTTELRDIVNNVAALLRPGGYLQWQECDVIDGYATPDSQACRDLVAATVEERVARGLFPAIVNPLVRALMSSSVNVPEGSLNAMSWSPDKLRISHLATLRTEGHEFRVVRERTKPVILQTFLAMLKSSVDRRKSIAAAIPGEQACAEFSPAHDQVVLEKQAALVEAIENKREDITGCEWNCEMTWIVARKAIITGQNEQWMSARYGK